MRICLPSAVSKPLIRVAAVKATNSPPADSSTVPAASSTILRPSGVSSARLEARAAAAKVSCGIPGATRNSVA
ncbi:Uncharacterised protein [Mycobacteroides abscessus subsp. abscessus]|nr:Uncharacterised protein [Mycobacteroides abscessus subsp. abscessus]